MGLNRILSLQGVMNAPKQGFGLYYQKAFHMLRVQSNIKVYVLNALVAASGDHGSTRTTGKQF